MDEPGAREVAIYEATGAKRLTYHKYRGLGFEIFFDCKNVVLGGAL